MTEFAWDSAVESVGGQVDGCEGGEVCNVGGESALQREGGEVQGTDSLAAVARDASPLAEMERVVP